METRFNLNTSNHPQSYGPIERKIHIKEDMLRACILEDEGNWKQHLPLIEFEFNNNYHSSIRMTPYEAHYGRMCKTPLCWTKENTKKIKAILEKIRKTQIRQKIYAYQLRRP